MKYFLIKTCDCKSDEFILVEGDDCLSAIQKFEADKNMKIVSQCIEVELIK